MKIIHIRFYGGQRILSRNAGPGQPGLFSLFILLMLGACTRMEQGNQNALERNLVFSGKNRPEMEKVLARYARHPEDSLKFKAAVFLISNMEGHKHPSGKWIEQFDPIFNHTAGVENEEIQRLKDSIEEKIGRSNEGEVEMLYDLKHLTADYLIRNIDEAFEAWQNAPWRAEVGFEAFCDYILPYKSFSEPPENWRSTLRKKYQYLLDDPEIPDAMEDICCALVKEEGGWFGYSEVFTDYPAPLSIFQILNGKKGNCVEMSNLAAYSARALGIPVAIDYTPQWANFAGAHMWNALILPEGAFWPFIGVEGFPGDYRSISEGEGKIAKAYRHKLAYDSASFAARSRMAGIRDIPERLSNPRISDVTRFYTQVRDIRFTIEAKENTPVYLCVFEPGSWKAVSGALVHNHSLLFTDMGLEALYMPMYYENRTYKAAGPPVLHRINAPVQELKAHSHQGQNLVLYRKNPLKRARIYNYMQHPLYHSRLEGSHTPEFNDPVLLHEIPPIAGRYRPRYQRDLTLKDQSSYDSLWREDFIPDPDSFRFIRFLFPKDAPPRLGELEVYESATGNPLKGIPMGNLPHPEFAFDGVPGRSIKPDSLQMDSAWVGLDLGRRIPVGKLRYLPADDPNSIEPGKKYELYYWDGRWKSAGTQIATGVSLEYAGIPAGTIYWLRCRDCGNREERPFTYENGKQMWW
ncbi:MAG TPA: transglutaminase domain-containing protein [Saprospiraceae bacterium]|nr:transglutaminase domain-containing protein [Saprospiraceae bacterium]